MTLAPFDVAAARQQWHPVATEFDLAPYTLFRGQLLGHEMVVWAADDGFVNVWENRCLHRGVRLSVGSNTGAELVCRYHAWRYANRSAGCTYIPAHPADSPARTITNQTFPTAQQYGLVWSGHDPLGDLPVVQALEADFLGLRNLPVNAPASLVIEHLATHRFLPSPAITSNAITSSDGGDMDLAAVVCDVETHDYRVELTARLTQGEFAGVDSTVVFFVQPVDTGRSVIRPVLGELPAEPRPILRHHANELTRLVRQIEQAAEELAEQAPLPPALEVAVVLPSVATAVARAAPLRVSVERKWETADGIAAFELAPTGPEPLPTFQPGAHIDVHLSDDLVRQYSITNGPGETDCYRIAVKREPESRGGSAALHDEIQQGQQLQISEPRNNFPLRRNIPHTLLIAGGIGVTPLLAMAQALAKMDLAFDLHYFVSAAEQFAFRDRLDALGDRFHGHVGLSPSDTGGELSKLLAGPDATRQVYACGPPPMLDVVRSTAVELGWPADAVHFEYFKNTTEIDQGSSFTIELARSALTLEVPSGSTILEVLRENDVPIVSSCEQGACGTCAATVLEGEPLHQDVYLNAAERAAGMTMLTCVSRTTGERLVLDL